MSNGPVVLNTSPLIALDHLGHLGLLASLFSSVFVPPAVVQEVGSLSLPLWITVHALTQPIGAQILSTSLGNGESEAISLALELNASWIVLDDRPARRLAQALRLPVIGTLGLLLAAKESSQNKCIKF